MTAIPAPRHQPTAGYAGDIPAGWAAIHDTVPQLANTMLTYVDQVKVSLRPASVKGTNTDLRIFATFLIGHDPALECVADIERRHIEAFKIWQHAQPGRCGGTYAPASFRRRITHLRMFFIRITEWDWNDAPARVPIFFGDVPKRDESLPKFLDDAAYTKFRRALAAEPHLYRRVAVELLARTGMRVGELCDLEADAVTTIGEAPWLRIPVGKLHNDRYVPLHPQLIDLLNDYTRSDEPHYPGRLLSGREGHSTATPSPDGSAPSPNAPASATSTPTSCDLRVVPSPYVGRLSVVVLRIELPRAVISVGRRLSA